MLVSWKDYLRLSITDLVLVIGVYVFVKLLIVRVLHEHICACTLGLEASSCLSLPVQ